MHKTRGYSGFLMYDIVSLASKISCFPCEIQIISCNSLYVLLFLGIRFLEEESRIIVF